MRDSVEAVVKGPDEKMKARRLETPDVSISQDFLGEKRLEALRDHGFFQSRTQDERELATAQRFVGTRNATSPIKFGRPYKLCKDSIWDAISESADGTDKLRMQVVVSEIDPQTWETLRHEGQMTREDRGEVSVHERLSGAIAKKIQRYDKATRSETVLLLDGWPGVTRDELQSFRGANEKQLAESGFREIWFVGPEACPVEQLV